MHRELYIKTEYVKKNECKANKRSNTSLAIEEIKQMGESADRRSPPKQQSRDNNAKGEAIWITT